MCKSTLFPLIIQKKGIKLIFSHKKRINYKNFLYLCQKLSIKLKQHMEQQKRYGHFDDQHREYVITDPQTPWPWINYLGNEDFFSLISNTAGGYSFYKDAKFRRITRYRYNNVPMDNGGRYFYVKDGETVWNPGWKPCKTPLDFYECRHGMSYTRITGKKNGVEASVLFFVPLK